MLDFSVLQLYKFSMSVSNHFRFNNPKVVTVQKNYGSYSKSRKFKKRSQNLFNSELRIRT